MGEWKAPLSLRVRQDFRRELEEAAARERRTLGNLCQLLLEWAGEQLKAAGTIERLLKTQVPNPEAKREVARLCNREVVPKSAP